MFPDKDKMFLWRNEALHEFFTLRQNFSIGDEIVMFPGKDEMFL